MKRTAVLAMIGFSALLGARPAVADPSDVCREFASRLHAEDGSGLLRYALEPSLEPGRIDQYLNLDIDGDDENDVVTGGCPSGNPSGDTCSLSVKLSSGPSFVHEFQFDESFYLVRLHGRVYAVVNHRSHGVLTQDRSVLEISPHGIRAACPKI